MSRMITLEDFKRLLSKVPMSDPAEVALYVAQNIKGQAEYLATAAKVTAEILQAEAAAARAKTDAAMARSLAEQASASVDAM